MALQLRSAYRLNFVILGTKHPHLAYFLAKNQLPHVVLYQSGIFSSLAVFIRIVWFFKTEKPDIVHCHLWRATLLGIPAAFLLRIPKRIFTRHHALVHYREEPRGRKWDRLLNMLATDIVAISGSTKKILTEMDKARPEKIRIIHHGFDLREFESVEPARTARLADQYQLTGAGPVVGVIARYVEWKGIQFIIPAFRQVLTEFPAAKLILANAKGGYSEVIRSLLRTLPDDSYREIEFEADLPALFRLMDVYVHTPVDAASEAFGQTYVEALASGIPSVFTLSGIAVEFIRNDHNALVVPFRNVGQIAAAVKRILRDPSLREHLVIYGRRSASLFGLEKMISGLTDLYDS